MSGEPDIAELQQGVKALEKAVDILEAFARPLDGTGSGNNQHNEASIMALCAQIHKLDGPVNSLLKIQSQCNEAVSKLYTYPGYAREARYCAEISLQAADFGSMAREIAGLMNVSINMLLFRAHSRQQNHWNSSKELQFWQDHRRLDHIAGIHSCDPPIPWLGMSTHPVRNRTDADRTLLVYINQLQRIPQHQRIILRFLDKMAWDMIRKHYKDEPWYKDIARD